MSLSSFLASLTSEVSSGTEIHKEASDEKFKALLERWSNEGVEIPGAIIRPATEHDVAIIVKAACNNSIPFVPASGGHSPWSTINSSGFILDLGLTKSIKVDNETQTVKVTGAVLVKELTSALEEAGRCTTLGNGNTVGVIPYFIGGGTSILTAMTGYACDQIVAAKIITVDGNIKSVSAEVEPDLLWAIKGAGQFFGVVLELTLKTFPLSLLGSSDGSHWVGNFMYSLDQAEEVCKAVENLSANTKYNTAGIIMVMAPPPAFQPMIAVVTHLIGDPAIAPTAFQSLTDLGPLMTSSSTPSFATYRDPLDYACAKGDFKSFSLAGITEFKTANFTKVIELFKELLATCPDAGASGYAFEWHTSASKVAPQDSAFGYQDVHLWMNTFSWYHQAENRDVVVDFDNRVMAAMRSGQTKADLIDYPNCNRTSPIEQRFRGEARLEKLRMLKKKWDPKGVFTRQFL